MSLCSPEQNGANACLFVFSHRNKMAAIVYESLFSEQNGDDVVFFSPAEMADKHVYLSLFPQCLWGEGATAANAVANTPAPPRPLTPVPTPPPPRQSLQDAA